MPRQINGLCLAAVNKGFELSCVSCYEDTASPLNRKANDLECLAVRPLARTVKTRKINTVYGSLPSQVTAAREHNNCHISHIKAGFSLTDE